MSRAYERYLELEKNLMISRSLSFDEESEDEILEEMDDLWWGLTDEEQAGCSRIAEIYYNSPPSVEDFIYLQEGGLDDQSE